jgi:hypothetical protein
LRKRNAEENVVIESSVTNTAVCADLNIHSGSASSTTCRTEYSAGNSNRKISYESESVCRNMRIISALISFKFSKRAHTISPRSSKSLVTMVMVRILGSTRLSIKCPIDTVFT